METRGQYGRLVGRETTEHTLELTTDEKELILKLYDYGLKVLQEESDRDCLNAVIAKLKDTIWP